MLPGTDTAGLCPSGREVVGFFSLASLRGDGAAGKEAGGDAPWYPELCRQPRTERLRCRYSTSAP